jgi:hypothetical protein
MDERKGKERQGNESQPGDGEKHEGQKDGGESVSACVNIKDFGHEAYVHVVHCSSVTNRVYCSVPYKAVLLSENGEL